MPEPMFVADFSLQIKDFHLAPRLTAGPEVAVIFGPSGAGKSLSLRAIAGLVRPSSGKIQLRDRVLFSSEARIDIRPQARRIGYLPQDYALFPHRTIEENIAYGLHRLPQAEKNQRVNDLLDLMRIRDQAHRKPGEVSGGQQQRAALARALAPQPDLLLMDEPFGALDQPLRDHLYEEFRKVQRRYQIPIILVTHNLAEAYSLADRLIVIENGQVVQAGDKDTVFRHPESTSIARLMGMHNILDVILVERQDSCTLVDWRGIHLQVSSKISGEKGKSLTLGVRPEDVIIRSQGIEDTEPTGGNHFRAILTEDRPFGYDHFLDFVLETQAEKRLKIVVRIPHPIFLKLHLSIGDCRTLEFSDQVCHVFPDPPGKYGTE
jgi:molybdate transport system ATP-binding protein